MKKKVGSNEHQLPSLLLERCATKTLSFFICVIVFVARMDKFSKAVSVEFGPNYAGFGMKGLPQEAGSVEGREQSLEMCDLYSAAPNAFVLLRSCISFAALVSSLLSLTLPLPPRPFSLCVSRLFLAFFCCCFYSCLILLLVLHVEEGRCR